MNKSDEQVGKISHQKTKHWQVIRRRRRIKNKKKNSKKAFNDFLETKPKEKRNEIRKMRSYTWIEAPKDFTFLENKTEAIKFINKIEKNLNNNRKVFVDLEYIKNIDYAAITVLLSIMFTFKKRRIKFNGNYPFDKIIKSKLLDSQFFEQLYQDLPLDKNYQIQKDNHIYGRGSKIVEPLLGKNVIMQASQTVWGEKRRSPGVQRSLLEIMQNTHNHADPKARGEKYWWVSVNHDKVNKKVSFGFVDYGQGIFESLNNKSHGSKWLGWYDKMKGRLKYGHNAEILQKLLEGELHMTVTGEHFRGKGLPGIREVLKRNQISNLHIISNDVHADVNKNDYSLLDSSFKGTLIYWELCYTNSNILWNQ